VFHPPEVHQERNEHDLLRDFKDEIPGYLRNGELTERLSELRLESGKDQVAENLRKCYQELVKHELFPSPELALLDSWLVSLEMVLGKQRQE
jgi:hypothetical protein